MRDDNTIRSLLAVSTKVLRGAGSGELSTPVDDEQELEKDASDTRD